MYSQSQALILASASPRRRELLANLGLNFEVVESGVVETEILGEAPTAMVQRLALTKAKAVATLYPTRWVLAADTDVFIDNQSLGKPKDAEHAKDMLGKLQGRTHQVFGGFALLHEEQRVIHVETHISEVTMIKMPQFAIDAYVATKEPFDKAGAYAVQGIGASLISEIKGSYTNVVGMNLSALIQVLLRYKVLKLKDNAHG